VGRWEEISSLPLPGAKRLLPQARGAEQRRAQGFQSLCDGLGCCCPPSLARAGTVPLPQQPWQEAGSLIAGEPQQPRLQDGALALAQGKKAT